MVKNLFNKNVKVVRSDNGSEFTSGPMQVFYSSYRILRENSCLDTLKQNGQVACKHHHALNVVRPLRLISSKLAYLVLGFDGGKGTKNSSGQDEVYRASPSLEEIKEAMTIAREHLKHAPLITDRRASF